MPCLAHNLIVLLIFPNPIVVQFLASSKLWLLKLYPQNHHSLIPNTLNFVCQLVSHVEPANFQRSVTANSQLWVLSTTLTNTSQIHIPNLIPTLPILGVLKAIRNHWDLPHWMVTKQVGLLNRQLATSPVRCFTNGFGTVSAAVDVLHPLPCRRRQGSQDHMKGFSSCFSNEHIWAKTSVETSKSSNIDLMM